MPQIILTLSQNIDVQQLDLDGFFSELHSLLKQVPNLDVHTCKSGVIQELYSHIGLGDPALTKIFLEVRWLGSEARQKVKTQIVSDIFQLLESKFAAAIQAQGLLYKSHVRIDDLGVLNQDYWIGSPT